MGRMNSHLTLATISSNNSHMGKLRLMEATNFLLVTKLLKAGRAEMGEGFSYSVEPKTL